MILGACLALGLVVRQVEPTAPDAALSAEMAALLHDTLRKLARRDNEEALRQHRANNHPAALELFKAAYALDPDDAEITNNLAITYSLLGNQEKALEFYRHTLRLSPDRAVAQLNLADLLSQGPVTSHLEEAASLLTRVRELKGNDPEVVLKQARVAARRNAWEEAERFYMEYSSLIKPTAEMHLEWGDFYRTAGREDEAIRQYKAVKGEAEVTHRAEERVRQVEVERQARRYGWSRPQAEPPPQARNLLTRARNLLRQTRSVEAREALKEALRVAPQFTLARVELADLHRAEGRFEEAELELLRALAFDQSNAELHARLGELHLEHGDAARASEAEALLARALQLRPDKNEWNLWLARAQRMNGDLPGALQHVNVFLEGDVTEVAREEAEQLRVALQALLTAPHEDPERVLPKDNRMEQEMAEKLGRARAYLSRGETDSALAELSQVNGSEREAEVRALEGRILSTAGRWPEAAQAFRASLKVNPNQALVHEQLGLVFMKQGRLGEARRHLTQAQGLGNEDAAFHLARVELETAQTLSRRDPDRYQQQFLARQRLDQFVDAHANSAYAGEARRLQAAVERELALVAAPPLAAVILVFLLMAWMLQRRFGGTHLKGLITRHPETGPEVQRLLASIRHEVLKHNTMVLSALVDAIERGDNVAAHAAHLQETLFGRPGVPAVVHRLYGYELQLIQLGRAHGERLNLRHKDAALTALHKGFEVLRQSKPLLMHVDTLSSRRRLTLLQRLRTAANLLNAKAYEGVRGLLDELRVLRVDTPLLQSIFHQTCREPALQDVKVHPLTLDLEVALPVGLGMPRAALQDILINLLRNALQAGVRAGLSPVKVGLGVQVSVDGVTGMERVVFLVRDQSPQPLPLHTLLGQRITGGLGITAEMVGRYEGTLDVMGAHDVWTKAVVVKLPREELGPRNLSIPPGLETRHA